MLGASAEGSAGAPDPIGSRTPGPHRRAHRGGNCRAPPEVPPMTLPARVRALLGNGTDHSRAVSVTRLAVDLAANVRDSDTEQLRIRLTTLSTGNLADLAVVLAGLANIDAPASTLLDWV